MRAIRAANYVRDAWSRGAALVGATAMLYTKGRYVAALRVARQAAGQPLNPAWHWLLAMLVSSINIRLGQPADALTIIDEALQLPQVDHDDRLRQNLLRQRAMALYQQGQVAEAIALALDAHRHLSDYYRDGSAGFSARQLALLLVLQGRVDEATTYVVQARTAFHDMGALEPLASLQAIELYAQLLRGQAARARAAVPGVLRRLDETEGNAQDLQLRLLLALVLGEGGEPQRALALAREIATQMAQQGYRLFLTSAQFYTAYLAGLCDDEPTRQAALRAGWALVAADNQHFIPMLPPAALRDVVVAALREEIAPPAISQLLRRQMPDQAMELLRGLLDAPEPPVRASAVRLLGELGASAAYPSLRALLKDRSAAVRQAAEDALSRLVYRPPYTLRVRTLGAFGIWRGDHEVRDRDWRSSKARQLFQLLLTERGRTLPRDRVLEALWPEMEPDAAANNLRVTLNRLGKAIEPDRPEGAPPAYLLQQGDTYGFNTGKRPSSRRGRFRRSRGQGPARRAPRPARRRDRRFPHGDRAVRRAISARQHVRGLDSGRARAAGDAVQRCGDAARRAAARRRAGPRGDRPGLARAGERPRPRGGLPAADARPRHARRAQHGAAPICALRHHAARRAGRRAAARDNCALQHAARDALSWPA